MKDAYDDLWINKLWNKTTMDLSFILQRAPNNLLNKWVFIIRTENIPLLHIMNFWSQLKINQNITTTITIRKNPKASQVTIIYLNWNNSTLHNNLLNQLIIVKSIIHQNNKQKMVSMLKRIEERTTIKPFSKKFNSRKNILKMNYRNVSLSLGI